MLGLIAKQYRDQNTACSKMMSLPVQLIWYLEKRNSNRWWVLVTVMIASF
jgi:hypothetical protein